MEKNEKHEEHFYKGLFFGLLIGIGVVWFSQTEKGKKLVRQAKEKVGEVLSNEMEEFSDEDEISIDKPKAKTKPAKILRKFFKK